MSEKKRDENVLKDRRKDRRLNRGRETRDASLDYRLEVWTPEYRRAMLSKHTMEARVSGFDKGLEIFGTVKFIFVKSKTHNILLMRDYQPTIGQIDGRISLMLDNEEKVYDDIKGFYMFRQNIFYLMIKEID